jgi:rhodanese-related sulfurtransferase
MRSMRNSRKTQGTVLGALAMAGGIALVAMRGLGREAASHSLASPRTPVAAPADAARMTVATLLSLVADRNALVVDVRTERSFEEGHVDEAVNVPLDEIGSRSAELIRIAAGRPIVTYCSCLHEHTSAIAAQELTAAGGRDVSALLGGYPAWVAEGGAIKK